MVGLLQINLFQIFIINLPSVTCVFIPHPDKHQIRAAEIYLQSIQDLTPTPIDKLQWAWEVDTSNGTTIMKGDLPTVQQLAQKPNLLLLGIKHPLGDLHRFYRPKVLKFKSLAYDLKRYRPIDRMRRAYPTFGLGTDSQKIYSNTSMNATYNPMRDFQALADEPLEGELANIDLTRDQLQDLRAQLSKFFIIGYDCSQPTAVTAVSSYIDNPCHAVASKDSDIEAIEQSSYQILQYESKREFIGVRCRRIVSQRVYYCGVYDHSTPYPDDSYDNRFEQMTHAECQEISVSGRYTFGDGITKYLLKDTQVEHGFFVLGGSGAVSKYDGTDVTCIGGTYTVDGIEVSRMVVYRWEKVIFREEKFIQRPDSSLIAFYDNVRIACPLHLGWCESSLSTYVWTPPTGEHCPLYNVRTFKGQIITYKGGQTKVLMSTDNSLIRFVLKSKTNECRHELIRTNYKDILIMKLFNPDGTPKRGKITRKLPIGEISLATFITSRDDVLYNAAKGLIRKEFNQVIKDECLNAYETAKTDHFLERKMPDYRSFRLGGEHYATVAGEQTYFYQCRPQLLVAQNTDKCYNALPVLTYSKRNVDRSLTIGEPSLFMEPITHRISLTSHEIPCIDRFFSRYKDIFGRWFALTPTLQKVDEIPEKIEIRTLDQRIHLSMDEQDNLDFSHGGIYTNEEIDSLQTYLEIGRVQEAITFKLATQTGLITPNQHLSPSVLFPSHTLPGGSWHTFILGKLWGAFRSLGEFTSAIIATIIIVRIIWFLIKLCVNCQVLYKQHGCASN